MNDPYKILGVSPDATDEQIKAAYRRLAKKYHPDLNPGDPAAAKKMQQVNAAYEQIKNPEKAAQGQTGGYNPYGEYNPFGGYGPFGGAWGQQTHQQSQAGDNYQQAAYRYIQYGRYREAINALNSAQTKDARWYYLSALANDGLGNQVTALEHIRRAVSMDPGNREYLDALDQIQNGGAAYRQRTGDFRGFAMRGSPCISMCLCYFLQMFCCGGRFYFCC